MGKVFKVFDDQDSGNICFGTEKDGEKFFVKFAGAPTEAYNGTAEEAIAPVMHGSLETPLFRLQQKAVSDDRRERYQSIQELMEAWNISNGRTA